MLNTLSMEQELRQIILPILIKNMDSNAHIYKCADQLVESLCKKLSTQLQSYQVSES